MKQSKSGETMYGKDTCDQGPADTNGKAQAGAFDALKAKLAADQAGEALGTLWITSLAHKSKVPAPTSYMQARPVYWFRQHDGGPIA